MKSLEALFSRPHRSRYTMVGGSLVFENGHLVVKVAFKVFLNKEREEGKVGVKIGSSALIHGLFVGFHFADFFTALMRTYGYFCFNWVMTSNFF